MGIISFSWEIGDFGEIMENQLSMGLFHGGSYGLPWGENHGNMVKKSWEKKHLRMNGLTNENHWCPKNMSEGIRENHRTTYNNRVG